MKKLLLAAVCALALAGCTTTQSLSAHQDAEKAMIVANEMYVAIASYANVQEASAQWTMDQGERLKNQAYTALLRTRALYNTGKAIDLSPLRELADANGAPLTEGAN